MLCFRSSQSWYATGLIALLSLFQHVLAYRPVQHCKTLGDNGHYSACAAITQHYNATTGQSDMFLRYHWFRYRNSKNGWHAWAIGQQMAGSFMLIMYGDPNTPSLPMTVDIRTSEGHAPPLPIREISRYDGHTPKVELVTAAFEEYKGDLKIESLNEKPTHVGICEVIIRGYETWTGYKSSNTSTNLDMIWASNYQQDMSNDFSPGRNIDMHSFGLGFGFLYVDMLNAATPEPMFGPLDEMSGMKGVDETQKPGAPTPEELSAGEKYIAQQISHSSPNDATPTTESSPVATEQAGKDASTQDKPIEQPVRTVMGKTIRDWMWHLHGLLMTLAFLALYPFGTYLIRSGNTNAFNSHWTVQSLATVALVIGSIIGYINSYSISVKHQYIGIAMLLAIATQILLGWRHHVQFLATKRKGWLSRSHIILGRIVLPVGYINIILGMQLRGYGWFTILLVIVLIVLECAFLGYILYQAAKAKSVPKDLRGNAGTTTIDDEAEEYFQLEGDETFSDSDEEADGMRADKEQAKREQADRLRRLDKV